MSLNGDGPAVRTIGGLTGRQWLALGASLLVTAAVLELLVSPAVLATLGDALSGASRMPLFAALGLMLLSQYLRAWRFGILALGRHDPPGATLLAITLRLNLFNYLLPFRLGEVSFPLLVRRAYRIDLLHGTGILLVARACDLCTVLALLSGALAATPLADRVPGGSGTLAALAPLCLVLPLALLGTGRRLAGAAAARRPADRRLQALAAELEALRRQNAGPWLLLASLAVWGLLGLASIASATAVPGLIDSAAALAGLAAYSLTFVIPVNGIAGIGPGPAAWAAMANATGAPWVAAVAAALLLQAVAVVGAVLGGLPALFYPLRDGGGHG